MKTLTDKEGQILGSLARHSAPTDPLSVALAVGLGSLTLIRTNFTLAKSLDTGGLDYVQELLREPSKADN